MELKAGHIVKGKLPFRDGKMPLYSRPYLIVKIDCDTVDLLNISSTDGKEWKLAMKSNMAIVNYDPPLNKPSFVKLDSRITVPLEKVCNLKLWGSQPLCESELGKIINALEVFEVDETEK